MFNFDLSRDKKITDMTEDTYAEAITSLQKCNYSEAYCQ